MLLTLLALFLVRTPIIVGGDPTICDSASCEHAASLLQKTQQRGKQVQTHRHTALQKHRDDAKALGAHPSADTSSPATLHGTMTLGTMTLVGGKHRDGHQLGHEPHSEPVAHLAVHSEPRSNPAAAALGFKPGQLSALPEKMMRSMILPDPYPCEMTSPEDIRFQYCGGEEGCKSLCGQQDLSGGLHPMNLSQTARWSDSVRLLMPIGSLPCCPTAPHCKAPACRSPASPVPPTSLTCTKASSTALYGYLTNRTVWPAYFGQGGSFSLDVQKHWDILGRLLGSYTSNIEPFDLAIDLGADWGSITELWTSRKYAKDFIVLDAYPANAEKFKSIFQDGSRLQKWYSTQNPEWPPNKPYPRFEFLLMALSNQTGGILDMCNGERYHLNTAPCPVPIMTPDSILPGKLSPLFQSKLAQAQSAYIKLDLDGMDQLAVDGMRRLLNEGRGKYENGESRYLVNFMMLEFCPLCVIEARQKNGYANYSLGTLVRLFESLGFELFMIGPHYLPISHGSWTEEYDKLFNNPYKCPDGITLDEFKETVCLAPGMCKDVDRCFFTTDLFAMRASHPRATEVKHALGACIESREFQVGDDQYAPALTEK